MAETRISNLRNDTPQRIRAALIRAVIEAARKQRPTLSASQKIQFKLVAAQMHSDLFFDRHRDLCKLMGAEPIIDKRWKSKDWRGTSAKLFEHDPLSMMMAMVLMHRYHPGTYSSGASDPLPHLVRVFKVKAAVIEKQVRSEIAGKIETVQAALKRRKVRQTKHAPKAAKS